MNESLHLGRVGGVRVGVSWTLFPIFLLIAWTLADTLLPSAAPGYSGWGYWSFALITTAAFYATLLAHELSHAFVARRHGLKVNGIVLWLFGGVAQLGGDTPNPRAELEVAAVGPATSFGIAAVGAVAAWLLDVAGASSLIVAALEWLAGINALLAVFNLLPAFPLDGGRILRGLLWRRWGDRQRATAAAAKAGRVGGFVLIAIGLVEFLAGGGALGGIWLAVVGWFITVAAAQQHAQVRANPEAPQLLVSDAMTSNPLTVPASATVAQVIEHYVGPSRFSSFPVSDQSGGFVGLTTARRMAELPRESWATAPITAAMAPRGVVVECVCSDRLADVAARLQTAPDRRAIVLEGGRAVGILTPSDVSRAVNRAAPFGPPPGAGQGAPSPGAAYANSYIARTRF